MGLRYTQHGKKFALVYQPTDNIHHLATYAFFSAYRQPPCLQVAPICKRLLALRSLCCRCFGTLHEDVSSVDYERENSSPTSVGGLPVSLGQNITIRHPNQQVRLSKNWPNSNLSESCFWQCIFANRTDDAIFGPPQ